MEEKKASTPVWGNELSKNFFEKQTGIISKRYDEFAWLGACKREMSALFAPEIANVRAKNPTTAERLAFVCDELVSMLKNEQIVFMAFGQRMGIALQSVSMSSGDHTALLEGYVEMQATAKKNFWAHKRNLDSHKQFVLGLKAAPEYAGNELLDYLLKNIEREPYPLIRKQN